MVEAVLWHGYAWLSVEMNNDATAERSSRINCDIYRALLSAPTRPNAAKLIRQQLKMDNDTKHTAKATQGFLKAK